MLMFCVVWDGVGESSAGPVTTSHSVKRVVDAFMDSSLVCDSGWS